jgi:hypothetical protein
VGNEAVLVDALQIAEKAHQVRSHWEERGRWKGKAEKGREDGVRGQRRKVEGGKDEGGENKEREGLGRKEGGGGGKGLRWGCGSRGKGEARREGGRRGEDESHEVKKGGEEE